MKSYKELVSKLNEASETSLEQLNPTERKEIDKLITLSKGRFLSVFDGIHGKVISILLPLIGQLNKKDVLLLSKTMTAATNLKTFRWVALDAESNGRNSYFELNIGF